MKSRLPLLSVVLLLTEPCFSQQVFYGSRRLAGGANYCYGSEASQTMQSTWKPQSGCDARIGRHGQTIKHSQASSPRTSHTRLFKAWAKRQAVRFGFSNVARREWRTAGVESGPNPSCDKRETWKSRLVQSRLGCFQGKPTARQARGNGVERIEQAKAAL